MSLISVLLMLWELPQIIIGRLVLNNKDTHVHTIDGVRVFVTNRFEGMSLGDIIFVNPNSCEGTWLVKHEFGHVKQSRYLGWLYLPLIFVPSYLWNRLIGIIDKANVTEDWYLTYVYHQFYTERWANWLIA